MTPEEKQTFDIFSTTPDSPQGFKLEVDLEFPTTLHDEHNDIPMAAEHLNISYDMLSPYSKLLYTDSLYLHVQTVNVYADLKGHFSEILDLSNFPVDHFLFDETNRGKLETLKNEIYKPIREFVGGTFWRYETRRSEMRYDTQGSKETELLSLVQLASLTIIHRIKRTNILSLPFPHTIKHYYLLENYSSLHDHFIPTFSDAELLNFYMHRDELNFFCDVPLPFEIYTILRTRCSSFGYLSDRSFYNFYWFTVDASNEEDIFHICSDCARTNFQNRRFRIKERKHRFIKYFSFPQLLYEEFNTFFCTSCKRFPSFYHC
ncbi:uncharacterized protein NPIL_177641 [Nephila pilipes]|uniref:Uncharacterized protein n=1 Tax=Nephila pilipes TaxID=299642 RepID=A0A8X6TQ12_NEPPI|nr:uncharacterized protein NPIL_177641 [Nephila pilipes]